MRVIEINRIVPPDSDRQPSRIRPPALNLFKSVFIASTSNIRCLSRQVNGLPCPCYSAHGLAPTCAAHRRLRRQLCRVAPVTFRPYESNAPSTLLLLGSESFFRERLMEVAQDNPVMSACCAPDLLADENSCNSRARIAIISLMSSNLCGCGNLTVSNIVQQGRYVSHFDQIRSRT
jgi:hypothetical protein